MTEMEEILKKLAGKIAPVGDLIEKKYYHRIEVKTGLELRPDYRNELLTATVWPREDRDVYVYIVLYPKASTIHLYYSFWQERGAGHFVEINKVFVDYCLVKPNPKYEGTYDLVGFSGFTKQGDHYLSEIYINSKEVRVKPFLIGASPKTTLGGRIAELAKDAADLL